MNGEKFQIPDYAERYIDQFSMVLVKVEKKAGTLFEKQVVNILGCGFNGLVYPTCDGDILRADLEKVLYRLEAKLSPYKGLALKKLTSNLSPDCEDSKNVAHVIKVYNNKGCDHPYDEIGRLATIVFMPVQGIFVRYENPAAHLFAAPFYGNSIGWADKYNNILEEKGGEK